MIFYRFQGSRELEMTSLHNDICEAWLRIDAGETEEEVFDIYEETLSLREIDVETLWRKILSAREFGDAEALAEKNPIEGVCCYASDETIVGYENYDDFTGGNVAANDSFVVIFEGEYLGDCGDGDIAKPEKLLAVLAKLV